MRGIENYSMECTIKSHTCLIDCVDILNKSSDDVSVKLVAITGAGDFFTSGNDLSAMLSHEDPAAAIAESRKILRDIVRAFFTFPKLLVAVVNGPCIGIGATLVALCDVIYASDTAYFYTPFSLLGLCAEACSSYTFPRMLGRSKASEMLLLNYKLYANEALRYNFVSEVVPKAKLDSTIWPKIQNYAKLSVESIKVSKALMQRFDIKQLEEALEVELTELYKRFNSDEFLESLTNFLTRKSKL